jgi:hypothetical protein
MIAIVTSIAALFRSKAVGESSLPGAEQLSDALWKAISTPHLNMFPGSE